MNREIVTELIQNDCNTINITDSLIGLVAGPKRIKMMENYMDLAKLMGEPGASARTAALILKYLH